jgi:ABC-type multidrug transport system ATPase subunit
MFGPSWDCSFGSFRVGQALCHTEPMLGALNLGKRYGSRWLFRHLELRLAKGDCLVVLGANGSGKSTLLKSLVGLVEPSEGSVELPTSFGYSSLDLALYPALTAAEHLEFSGHLRGLPSRADELLETVGLGSARNQRTDEYSTGMRARLKLAIALQARPDVLIMDEPGAGLDQPGRDLIQSVIESQLAQGVVVLATNDPLERRFATFELEVGP